MGLGDGFNDGPTDGALGYIDGFNVGNLDGLGVKSANTSNKYKNTYYLNIF